MKDKEKKTKDRDEGIEAAMKRAKKYSDALKRASRFTPDKLRTRYTV